MTPQVIDLKDHRTPGVRLLSGRDRGELVREAAGLAALDEALIHDPALQVVVRIPDDIVLLSSSFLLGMFGPSVRALGESEFRNRFQFEGPYSEHFLSLAIREALKRGSPLRQMAEPA